MAPARKLCLAQSRVRNPSLGRFVLSSLQVSRGTSEERELRNGGDLRRVPRGAVANDATLEEIGEAHGKPPTQVALRADPAREGRRDTQGGERGASQEQLGALLQAKRRGDGARLCPAALRDIARYLADQDETSTCVIVPICTENRLRFSARLDDRTAEVRFERAVRTNYRPAR
jgi:hypothetical protein